MPFSCSSFLQGAQVGPGLVPGQEQGATPSAVAPKAGMEGSYQQWALEAPKAQLPPLPQTLVGSPRMLGKVSSATAPAEWFSTPKEVSGAQGVVTSFPMEP